MAKRGHYHNSNKPVHPVKITRTTLVEEPSDEEGFNIWKLIAITSIVIISGYVLSQRPNQVRQFIELFSNLHTENQYDRAWPEQKWPNDNWGPPPYTK